MRDSHEFIQKQVWGEQLFLRQIIRRLDLERTCMTEACIFVNHNSIHLKYVYAKIIFVHSDVSQI